MANHSTTAAARFSPQSRYIWPVMRPNEEAGESRKKGAKVAIRVDLAAKVSSAAVRHMCPRCCCWCGAAVRSPACLFPNLISLRACTRLTMSVLHWREWPPLGRLFIGIWQNADNSTKRDAHRATNGIAGSARTRRPAGCHAGRAHWSISVVDLLL